MGPCTPMVQKIISHSQVEKEGMRESGVGWGG